MRTTSGRRDFRRPGLGAGIALAPVVVAVWADGGYSAGARLAFGVAAIVAAATALATCPRGTRAGLARDPVAIVLLALAGLGALSALWTLGPVERTLRWALVCAGYAGVALAARVAAGRRGGVELIAAGVAVLAAAAGAAGLGAAVAFDPGWAERIAGVWRPGGPFEYPPALALLEVSALPVLITAMAGRSRAVACCGAAGMAVAGGVLALSASRLSLAMAVAVGGLALAAPGLAGSARRATVAAALAVGVAAGVSLAAAASGPQAVQVATLIAAVALAPLGWPATRRALDRRPTPPPVRRPRWAAIVAVAGIAAIAAVAGSAAFGTDATRGVGASGGFLHGREATWRAALETFADRPILGAGADAFLAGSARHQGGQTIAFAHDLPLELAAELGVAGLFLAIALYFATGSLIRRARDTRAVWLLGPAAAAFLLAGLVDWPWHLAGAGAVWAVAIGALASAPDQNKKHKETHDSEWTEGGGRNRGAGRRGLRR